MALDEPKATDQQFDQNGIKIVIDETSGQYLNGAQVDYVESMMGGGFKIENPQASSTCGCGSSFRTEDAAGKPGSCS